MTLAAAALKTVHLIRRNTDGIEVAFEYAQQALKWAKSKKNPETARLSLEFLGALGNGGEKVPYLLSRLDWIYDFLESGDVALSQRPAARESKKPEAEPG